LRFFRAELASAETPQKRIMVLTSDVIAIVQEIEQRMLHSLESPSSDGYMPAPVPKYIKQFQEIRLSHLATSMLESCHGLDQESYTDFVAKLLEKFSQFEVSRANLHYCCDKVSSCVDYLKQRLLAAWKVMSGGLFLEKLDQALASSANADFASLFWYARRCRKPEQAQQIKIKLLELKQVHRSQMAQKLEFGLNAIANIENVLFE
jgi:hypothetical protein